MEEPDLIAAFAELSLELSEKEMPWEIWVRRSDHTPLGDRESVKQAIASTFPGIQFYRDPSGPERIEAARAVGVEFPDILRKHLEACPSTEQADFESGDLSIRFFLGAEAQLDSMTLEVRGETERAIPFLEQLAAETGWVITESRGEPLIR